MEPKKCESLVSDIEQFKLEQKDEDIFSKIKELIYGYEFDEALEILEEEY
jgi:hypothetical protein